MTQQTASMQKAGRAVSWRRALRDLWLDLREWSRYLFFLRVVVLTCLFMVLLPLGARWSGTASLLAGLFDLSAWDLFWVTLLQCLIVLNAIVITHLILINGGERFELHQPYDRGSEVRALPPNLWLLLTFLLLIVVTIGLTYAALPAGSFAQAPLQYILATGGGLIVALLLSLAALGAYHNIVPHTLDAESPTILEPLLWLPLPAFLKPRRQRRRWERLYINTLALLKRWRPAVPRWLGRGFFSYPNPAADTVGHLYPGYIMAIILLIFWLAVYTLVYVAGRGLIGATWQFPALAYSLLLVMTCCWVFATLAFFLDRGRWPLLLTLIGISLVLSTPLFALIALVLCWLLFVVALWRGRRGRALLLVLLVAAILLAVSSPADSYYGVVQQADEPAVPASTLLDGRDTLIVVAANGGGIQSAAWTAQVLSGLERRAQQEGLSFGRSIRLISAVSGGSVGAMHFVNAYSEQGPPSGEALTAVVERANASSLNAVVWGMAYPDLVRTLLPFINSASSRGTALEEAWSHSDPALTNTLGSWRQGVLEGWRPATVFNATVAETGERLTFSTTDFAVRGGAQFHELSDFDLSIVTAARLSATFPFVTPAARATEQRRGLIVGGMMADRRLPPALRQHVVDGGYYDNYGMVTLVDWLDQALDASGGVTRVLVLQIRGAPGSADTQYTFDAAPGAEGCSGLIEQPKRESGATVGFYQVIAPLTAMLQVRNTSQLGNNDTALALLQRAWERRGVTISTEIFQYYGVDAPLSWHLTAAQQASIARHWQAHMASCFPQTQGAWERIRPFLEGTTAAP